MDYVHKAKKRGSDREGILDKGNWKMNINDQEEDEMKQFSSKSRAQLLPKCPISLNSWKVCNIMPNAMIKFIIGYEVKHLWKLN